MLMASPARTLAALAPAKIPRRRIPCNFKIGSWTQSVRDARFNPNAAAGIYEMACKLNHSAGVIKWKRLSHGIAPLVVS